MQYSSKSGLSIDIVTPPKKCSICHHAIAPKYIDFVQTNSHGYDFAFQCTNCHQIFIAKYEYNNGHPYRLSYIYPKVPQKIDFEKEIEEISPLFSETYNQSLYAESNSLHQLTGIGLRKSLEYLIKDFLIAENPEKEESIKKSTLAQCIENFIDDTNLKEVSKRATWLGNDETHYVKKWEDKDINDLKILVKLTVNWIHNILLTKKYISEMQ